jgi:hypothetical protein
VKGKPRLKLRDGDVADYHSGSGPDTLAFRLRDKSAAAVSMDLNGGFIIAGQAGVKMRRAQIELQSKSK